MWGRRRGRAPLRQPHAHLHGADSPSPLIAVVFIMIFKTTINMSLPDLFPVLKGCRSYALLRYIPHHISGFFNTSIAKLIFPRMPPPRRTWFGRGASWLSAACTAELHVLNDEYIRQWHQGVKLSGWPPIAKKYTETQRKCQLIAVFIVSRCETTQRLHCHSVLRALQSNVYFQNCLCEQSDPDLDQCLQVHRKIFLHSCVRESSS